ncbi:hypothetical protein PPYR_15571, partial [Photinus pyralis]
LMAVFNGISAFTPHLRNLNILIRPDNTTGISCINRMGSVSHTRLNMISRQIWDWCEERNLWISAAYVSSKENWKADAESRALLPETEWSLHQSEFEFIVSIFGNPEIDLFASKENKKCKRYISWKRNSSAEAVDAFTVPWKECFFYAFPPFSLILRTLRKIIEEEATGIVVVPFWKSQPWYPLFCKLSIDKIIHLGPNDNLL